MLLSKMNYMVKYILETFLTRAFLEFCKKYYNNSRFKSFILKKKKKLSSLTLHFLNIY